MIIIIIFSQKAETWAAENKRHLQHTVNALWPVGWWNLGSVKKLAMKRREKVRDKREKMGDIQVLHFLQINQHSWAG